MGCTNKQLAHYRKKHGLVERHLICPHCETEFSTWNQKQMMCGSKSCKKEARRVKALKRYHDNKEAINAARAKGPQELREPWNMSPDKDPWGNYHTIWLTSSVTQTQLHPLG